MNPHVVESCRVNRWEIAGPVIFFFLLGLLNLNIDGALFYFCRSAVDE